MNRYKLLLCVLFMSIGFAAVNTSLSIGNNTDISNILEEFDVYFSDVRVNGVQDYSPVDNSNTLSFKASVFDKDYIVDYEITNSSGNYDSNVNVSCVTDNLSVKITNEFDSSSVLEAHDSRLGKLSLNSYWNFIDSDNSGGPSIGDVVSFENEKFNITSVTDDKITMLAQDNLSSSYRQTSTNNYVYFTDVGGWGFGVDININDYEGSAKTYIAEYDKYFRNTIKDNNLLVSIITLGELNKLGCTSSGCTNSDYKSWLVPSYRWWTRSAVTNRESRVYGISATGVVTDDYSINTYGLRPTVTISKEATITCSLEASPVENQIMGDFEYAGPVDKCDWIYKDTDNSGTVNIGDEYSYCNEKFYVINDDTNINVSLLTKTHIGSDFKQSTEFTPVHFANNSGWPYTPGPKDIDIQKYGVDAKKYVNSYVSYLKRITGTNKITGDLISLQQLGELGCIVSNDYSNASDMSCVPSKYYNWVVLPHSYWTKSAYSAYGELIWIVYSSGILGCDGVGRTDTVIRPVITIPSYVLNNIELSESEAFCNNLGYTYGMDYIQTYQGGDEDQYLMPSYRCTNDADYKTYDYYAIDGTLLYKFTGGIDPYIPED